MYSSESAAHGSLLLALSVLFANYGEDAAVGNHHNMLATEFLLQFPNKSSLNLVEALEKTVGDENQNGALATTKINRPRTTNEQLSQFRLEISRVNFEIEEGLSDL